MTPEVAETWLAFFKRHEDATALLICAIFWGCYWILSLVEAARKK